MADSFICHLILLEFLLPRTQEVISVGWGVQLVPSGETKDMTHQMTFFCCKAAMFLLGISKALSFLIPLAVVGTLSPVDLTVLCFQLHNPDSAVDFEAQDWESP